MDQDFSCWFPSLDGHQQRLQHQMREPFVRFNVGSLIDHLRSLILSRVSATCKVLFEVIPFGASSRHPRRQRPEGDIRDA